MNKSVLRIAALLVCLLFAMALVAGCGGGDKEPAAPSGAVNGAAPGDDFKEVDLSDVEVTEPAKTLAEQEKAWLNELTDMVKDLDELYDLTSVDAMLYANFIVRLNEIKPVFEEYKVTTDQYLVEHNVAEAYKNDPLYTNGLVYGQKMREQTDKFFTGVFEGVVDESGKTKDLSKQEVLELYKETMVDNFNKYYRQLNNALTRVEEAK